jgi:hypothetical protein
MATHTSGMDLQFRHFLGHMYPMPKKRKRETDLSRLIKGMKLSLTDFAKEIGYSNSSIKSVIKGTRPMTQELKARVFAETGIIFVDVAKEDEDKVEPLVYSKKDHQEFKKESAFNEKAARVAAGLVAKQVELLLLAASRPTVGKSLPIFTALQLALEKIKGEFRLEKHVDALLRERHATQTKLYTVKELRANDLLAKQVAFKDDPLLKDEDQIPLAKTTGWLPAKDCFNVAWQNRELFDQLAASQDEDLTEAQKARFEKMRAEMNAEIDAFLPVELRGQSI